MKVHVVLADAMGGVQYCGAFTTSTQANQRLIEGVFGKSPRDVECSVTGVHPDPNVVFFAQTYNRTMDIHDFEGVYGNHDSALLASGLKGQPLRVTL